MLYKLLQQKEENEPGFGEIVELGAFCDVYSTPIGRLCL